MMIILAISVHLSSTAPSLLYAAPDQLSLVELHLTASVQLLHQLPLQPFLSILPPWSGGHHGHLYSS